MILPRQVSWAVVVEDMVGVAILGGSGLTLHPQPLCWLMKVEALQGSGFKDNDSHTPDRNGLGSCLP